jgi:flagellar biosynthesis protein FlhB
MANDDAGERTEPATPRRRQEAREEGRVAKSTDLVAAAGLLASLLLLNSLGSDLLGSMFTVTKELGRAGDPAAATLSGSFLRAVRLPILALVPILIGVVVATACSGLLQTGALVASKLLMPKLEHISPMKGARRLFSTDSLVRLGQSLLKLLFVGAVAYSALHGMLPRVLGASGAALEGLLWLAADLIYTLALRVTIALLILGLIDYFYQRWKLERGLRMTKQEVREEMKSMDGDPQLKQHRRQIQMRLAAQRLRVDVPRADVIVTNPTEYAVAIQYDDATMRAPRVVAKGKDFMALQIRQIAALHRIPIVQRPPLARGLFAAVEVGGEVPPLYYRAVAEVLAYVYQIAGRVA